MGNQIGQIATHYTAPSSSYKIEVENPTGPTSGYSTLAEAFSAIVTQPTVWTPSDQSGAALTLSPTTGSSNTYYQIGKLVLFTFDFSWPVQANGATVLIGGLPAAAATTGTNAQTGLVNLNTGAGGADRILIFNGSATFAPCTVASVSPTNSQMSGARLRGSGMYFTA